MGLKGKVAWCPNSKLKPLKNLPGGHYVYIRNIHGNKVDVNVITSLSKNGNINLSKINHVKNGNIYPIPLYDSNFKRWSGVNHSAIYNVDISALSKIGFKSFKYRHRFFIGKFFK